MTTDDQRKANLQAIVKGFVNSREQLGYSTMQVAEAITKIKKQMAYVKSLRLRANMKMVTILHPEIQVLMPTTMVQRVHTPSYDRYMRHARKMQQALTQCELELQTTRAGQQLKLSA